MGEKVELQQTACMEYQTLQQSGLQVVEDDLMTKFSNLRKKIINTDIVIQKYNLLEKKFDVNRKHLDKANLLITKLQKDLNYSDTQLREALLITDPLKKQNAEIVSQNFVLSNKVTNLEEKLTADEKTRQQLEAALKNLKEDAENVELLEAALNKEKKSLEKLAKSKEEAISLKDTLKEARCQYQKLQHKNKTVVKYMVLFGKLLQDRNLLNKVQKRVFIKYSSQDDSKEHSGSDTPASDLDDEGLLIESQLLNAPNSASDVSIQTETLCKTQYSQTEGYSEVSDAILNDVIQQFISIPKALSPLPPSPKRYNRTKSGLDSSNKSFSQEALKETIVPLECCGCCKKVVRQQEEIDILKSNSCEISRKSQGNSQNTHNNYKEKSCSFNISPVNPGNGVWETVEENLIDNDHSYCSAKIDQNTNVTARNEVAIERINTGSHKSEYPSQEPSKCLAKSTLNRFTVPFFKKGSIFRSEDENISCPLLETRYKVKFFKKSNLYSEDDEFMKKINFGPNLNIKYNSTYARNNKNVGFSCPNSICKSTATEQNNNTQKRAATRNSHSQNESEMAETIFEADNLFSGEIDRNTFANPLKTSLQVKRLHSRITSSTTLKRPRAQPGINPLKVIEKCRQSLKKSIQIGNCSRNGAIVAQAKSANAKNVINIESGASVENYTTPVPKKARLSRCSTESARPTPLEIKVDENLNDSYDELMTELFGDEEEKTTCNNEPLTNVIKDVVQDICQPPRVAEFGRATGKEKSDIPSIKANDVQNNTATIIESVQISEEDEAVHVFLNEQQINNSTDELISNVEKKNTSLVATPAADIRENSTEIIYKLTWNSLLSKNIFAKRQHIQKNEMKSGSDVIKSVIQVMASLSMDLLNVEHIWKGMVHRLEEAFSNNSLDVNLLVIELSNWVQTNPIATLDLTTGLPVIANTKFSSILAEEEIKCSILTKYLKMSSIGERYLDSIHVNFTDAMMSQSNMTKKCALCRFLMFLHKENKNMEAARILCYDVMYHLTSSSGALLTYMFSIWPEAFSGDSAKKSCIMKTIGLLLRKEHAELGVSKGFVNVFHRFFHSINTTDDLDENIIILLHQLGHDKSLYFEAAKSIELIAKVKRWNWTKLLIQRLMQILSRNGWKLLEKKDLMPENLVKSNLLYLLGCLGKQSPLEDTETNRNILKLAKLFISTPKEPFCIKETAALVSVMLLKFDQGTAIFMVQKWLPYNTRRISESLKMLLIKHNLWSS